MSANPEEEDLFDTPSEVAPCLAPSSSAPPPEAASARRRMGFGQRVFVLLLLPVVVVPPAAGFYSYFTGVPLRLLASPKEEEREFLGAPESARVELVSGVAHTVEVPEEVCAALGIRKGERYAVAVARRPSTMRPLVLPGSTQLDPALLGRVRARFAPCVVVSLAQVQDRAAADGRTIFRELRQGDTVAKGDPLGVFYSLDVGLKKNDLLDALVQLELDQTILDRVEANLNAVPEVYRLTQQRAVQGDRNAVQRAINNLKLWGIPQEDIDALQADAEKIAANRDAWEKTPEGRWVKREKQDTADKHRASTAREKEDSWGRVRLHSPFDGVIVEKNVHVDETVVDNTVNLFQIADVSRLMVVTHCPEDALPTLEALSPHERKWTIHTVGTESTDGLSGTVDEIGYLIDPNQHTAIVKGYVDNPGKRIRAGQFVTATVNVPPPNDVVEIPADALVDDGVQCLVFVQSDEGTPRFTMRRVQVAQRFEHTVFVRSSPIPKDQQPAAGEVVFEEDELPAEALRPGERVLLSGAVELKAALVDLESRHEHEKKPATGKG